MKLKVIAVVLMILGAFAGYGLAYWFTGFKYFDSNCPNCNNTDAVIAVVSEARPDESQLRVFRKDNRHFMGYFDKTASSPDCYCIRCRALWHNGDMKTMPSR